MRKLRRFYVVSHSRFPGWWQIIDRKTKKPVGNYPFIAQAKAELSKMSNPEFSYGS